MKVRPALFFAAALIMSAPLAARELPPEGTSPREYQLPAVETYALDNGMTVQLVPFGNVPKVAVALHLRSGNIDEGDRVWLADLTAEMLREGSAGMDATGVAKRAARLGGQVGISVGADETRIAADVLSEFGPEAVRLVADVVRRPEFPDSELERVRTNMLTNLEVALSQPQSQANRAFNKLIYGEHPYGRVFPEPSEFSGLTIDDVREFYRDHYGAARATLIVAGRFDRASVVTAIDGAFANWAAGTKPQPRLAEPSAALRVELIDRPGAPQSTIYIGLPVVDPSHPDHVALSLTNTLLGGYFSSRITSNLREDKGYTYSPRSQVSPRYRTAVWLQRADVTTQFTGPALAEIFKEIAELRSEPPPAEELARVKNYRIGTFVLNNATRNGLIGQLAFLNLHGLDRDYLTGFVSRLNAVTPEEVRDMALRYLDRNRMTLVVVGDLETVRPQLAALAELDAASY